jgi:DnaD/phage-associated family protein
VTAARHPQPVEKDGEFTGFPSGARATVLPSAFFTSVLPGIEDPAEMRVTLFLFYALGRHRGYPRFLTRRELEALPPLAESLAHLPGEVADNLDRGLELAAGRGGLPRPGHRRGRPRRHLIFLNTPADRRALSARSGRSASAGRCLSPPRRLRPSATTSSSSTEENIGPMTPLVAEELREAERHYPSDWIEEAFKEAAVLNKRSWRYAARILERWAMEGRQSEKAGRDPAGDDSIRARVIRRFDTLARDR